MIIYNVTIKVEDAIAEDWVLWMKNEHIGDVLGTGLFTDCRLCRLIQDDEQEGVTYVAQYYCESMTEYNEYIDNHAQQMREKGFKKFGSGFVAFRTVMETV